MNFRKLQARLNELGFRDSKGRRLVEDGYSGPNTDFAIVAFKRSIGFRARPYVGTLTYEALMGSTRTPDPAGSTGIPWLDEALRMMGLHERRNKTALKGWFDKSVAWIDPREVPWCGAFEATIYRKWDSNITLPENPLGAKNWSKFGVECKPQLGCTLTFHRGKPTDWRGHVANYIGESSTAYLVIGGNQSDAITKTWIAKKRLHSSRWPLGFAQSNKTVLLNSNGRPLSTNEA